MADVLVVDDDEVFGDLMVDRLQSSGHSAEFHHGWFKSLVAIAEFKPRLVILDINMPGMTGTRLAELVRQRSTNGEPRILLMSSMDQAEVSRLAAESHADAGLTKSATKVELLATVKRLLAIRAA